MFTGRHGGWAANRAKMTTVLAFIGGVLSTILVGHYYYVRSTRRHLSVYEMVNANLFNGIDPEVQRAIHITYRDAPVEQLQHLELLIVNDGRRPIAALLEPIRVELPSTAQLLDARVLYKHPDTLPVTTRRSRDEITSAAVFECALLNPGDFFLVKLLLSGKLEEPIVRLLGEDLPHAIEPRWLPLSSMRDRRMSVEWDAIIWGALLLSVGVASGFSLVLLRDHRPELFPYPWVSFRPSVAAMAVAGTAGLALLSFVLGLLSIIGLGFGESFTPQFALPREFRHRRLPHIAARQIQKLYEGSRPPIQPPGSARD